MIKLIYKKAMESIGFALSIALWVTFGWATAYFYNLYKPVHVELIWAISRAHNISDEASASMVFLAINLAFIFAFVSAAVLQMVIREIFY
jgi:hypothetical protein